jgi:hypothetical protein
MATAQSLPLIRLRLKPTLRLTPGGYLFDGATAESYTLNPAGQCIVRSLLEGGEPARLWCELVAQFEVSEARARRDVRRFLSQLRQQRLLVEDFSRPL